MNDPEALVFMAEIKKDIQYIKERVDEKFKAYDEHIKESPAFRDKVNNLEGKMTIVWSAFAIIAVAIINSYFKMYHQ